MPIEESTPASTSAPASASASGPAPSQRQPVTADTFLDLRLLTYAQLSPDGMRVAFVLDDFVAGEQKSRGRIWLVSTDGGDARPITSGPYGDSAPRWSPDGTQLAFLSARDDSGKDKPQVHIMPAGGGEPRRVCTVPNGAAGLSWSPDGSRLAFLSPDGDEPTAEPKVNEFQRQTRLWSVRPEHDVPRPVTPANLTIWTYTWSPDSARVAVYCSAGPGETDWYRGQIGIVPAAGGAVTPITTLTRQADALTWTRDSQRIVYVSGEWSDRGLIGGDVFIVDANGGEPRNLTPGIAYSPSWLAELPEGGGFLFAAWNSLTSSIGILDA
ncbi:MAG: hypothetical protein ACRDHP_15085, partial [Ktedonobacterales bacterium]